MNEERFDAKSLDLPPSREFEAAAALLAYAAGPSRPPAELRRRVLAAAAPARPSFSARRYAAVWAAMAALLLAPAARRPAPRALLAQASPGTTIDGRPARLGEALPAGRVLRVSGSGEAVVRVAGRIAARLSRGGALSLSQDADGLALDARSGWLLSAVVPGTPYRVSTPHGDARALGTEFMLKLYPERVYVCICRGALQVSGGFGRSLIQAPHHAHYDFSRGSALHEPYQPSLDGHRDQEIEALKAALR